MARNTSISLGDHFSEFVDTQVDTGRFSTASEVVRAGLRLLEEHETRVKTLQNALIEGEQSGPAFELSADDFIASMKRPHSV